MIKNFLHSSIILIVYANLYYCKPKKEDNTVRNLLILSALTPKDIYIDGVVKGSGILKNAKIEAHNPGSNGECTSSTSGSKIQETTSDESGFFSMVLSPGVYCILALPSTNTILESKANGLSTSEKNISFSNYNSSIPYLSAIVSSSGKLNLSPLTRIAAERFYELKRQSGVSYSISSYLSPITSSSSTQSRPTDPASLAVQANQEIAEIFFPQSSSIQNIAATSIDLTDSSVSDDEKKMNLLIEGLSSFASKISADTDGDGINEPTIKEYELTWTAISKDLSDGMADGVYFNGSTTENVTLSGNNVTIAFDSLSGRFQREILSYASSSDNTYTTSDANSLEYCPVPSYNGNCYSSFSCSGSGPDPYYSDQWHLNNTGQSGGTIGEDTNVTPVWSSGNYGQGIIVSVVDDGADIFHEDLKENFIGGNYNFISSTSRKKNDPSSLSMSHGTSVSGVIAAKIGNEKGLRGVAPCAQLVALNLLQNYTTENEITAMSANYAIAVSNNSWGATDGLGTLAPANSTWKDAVVDGLTNARGGKGTIYVWAAGNGSSSNVEIDNSNYDGQANHYGIISVGAIGNDGKLASYSDKGANVLIASHSQGYNGGNTNVAISTTDVTGSYGYNSSGSSGNYSDTNYTNTFNGTSSSAPVVSGVAALILKQNPELTWRDVRMIIARSARKNDPTDSDWSTNTAGYSINHKYGFGSIDANSAVNLASTWTSVGGSSSLKYYPSSSTFSESSPGSSIPDNNSTGVSSSITISGSSISKIEFIEIKVNITHNYPGDLKIVLKNGSGTSSELAIKHNCYSSVTSSLITCTQYSNWVFGSVRHLDESADGTWTLTVSDLASQDTGTFTSWGIKFYGR